MKNKTNWVYNYKKHKCSKNLTRQAEKQIDELKETTLHPKLHPNKYMDKVIEGRKMQSYVKCTSKRYSIYEHLYNETVRRQIKKDIKN